MALLAVSFCNQKKSPNRVLAIVDTETEARVFPEIGIDRLLSACGLVHDGTHLFCACTDKERSYLAVFDARADRLEEVIPIPEVADAHSVALDGDAVIIASTGTDEIVRFVPSAGTVEVLYRVGNERTDTQHLNAVVWHQGRLLCTGFGVRSGSWASASNGYIYDVSGASYVKQDIYHPHSLVSRGDDLYFCESSAARIRSLTSEAIAIVPGYARGLAISPEGRYYAGSSSARRASGDAPELVRNPADEGDPFGECAIHSAGLDGDGQASLAFGDLASEIYDVLVLPA